MEKHNPINRSVIKKPRQDSDVVNIDGKNVIWGKFKKRWQQEAAAKQQPKNKWLINKGNKKTEKFLYWDKSYGFRSDDSDDE